MYYVHSNRGRRLISRCNLDGTNTEKFVLNDVPSPHSLVVLPRRRELCWVDDCKLMKIMFLHFYFDFKRLKKY